MKRKSLYIVLGTELVILFILALLTDKYPALFSSLLAFPFEQLGAGLRTLSLSGRIGNGLALTLWGGISMLPIIPVLGMKDTKSCKGESSVLILLSVSLLFVLYLMANPAGVYSIFPGAGNAFLPVMKAIMGLAVWSIAVLWVVLRLLRLFRAGDTNKLLGYLRIMLYALCGLFTAAISLSCGTALLSSLANMQRGLDGMIAVIRFMVAALPYAIDIIITLSAVRLLDALLSEGAANAGQLADKLSRLCCVALAVVTTTVALFNLLQLALAQYISNVTVTVDIPVMSIAFVLATLLVSRLIAENQRLKSDNDLFI